MRLFRLLIVCTAFSLLTACVSEKSSMNQTPSVSDNNSVIKLDYSKLDEAVKRVLNENPDFSPSSTVNSQDINEMPLTSFFDRNKTEFRLKVERILAGLEYVDSEIKTIAQKIIDNQINLLEMAEKKHGLTVSQVEVSDFIKSNVMSAELEEKNENEKRQYSDALGISPVELDTIFDRDFYIMDVLYEKIAELDAN